MNILKDKYDEWDFSHPALELPSSITTYMDFLEKHEEKETQKYLNRDDLVDKFWYLASPYPKQKNINQTYLDTAKMLAFLIENNIFVFSPIVHSHTASKYITKFDSRNSSEWTKIAIKYLLLSKGIIVCMMEVWEESKGIAKEIELAAQLRLPIIYTKYMELPKA